MEIKKDPRYDLENKKGVFVEIGLFLALVFVLSSFEWKKYDEVDTSNETMVVTDIPEEMIEITRQEEIKPPPPQQTTTVINIVEDDVVVEDDFEFDSEDDQNNASSDVVTTIEETAVVIEEAEIFTIVEEMPSFNGGDEALYRYLGENIKYPQMARESGIQGTVYCQFVVEPDGRVSNVTVRRGIGGGCDEEAIRVVKAMPSWKPGKQRGKPVRVSYTLPVKFTLQ